MTLNQVDLIESIDEWMGGSNALSTFICVNCDDLVFLNELFVSTNCSHYYCIECASEIINQSLSLLNEIPKCILSDCNKSFNISKMMKMNQFLFTKYQIKQENTKQYRNDKFLLNGYIRRIFLNIIVPSELIALIHDFYKLICFTELGCNNCNSLGFEGRKCNKCDGNGYTEYCINCRNGIISYFEDCSQCKSFGKYVINTECSCLFSTNSNSVCLSCNGYGISNGFGGRGECFECNGSGKASCNDCDGGIIATIYHCNGCNGNGKINKTSKCGVCDGNGYNKKQCNQCSGIGQIPIKICLQCNFNGTVLYTDFNKIVSKQKYCNKCNYYYPGNMIIFWSECYHTFCIECIMKTEYIKYQIDNKQIPICPLKDCKKELNRKEMKLYYVNHIFITNLSQNNIINHYLEKLDILKSRKNKFKCSMCCYEWHSNKEMLLFSHCGHKYTIKCSKTYIENIINNGGIPFCKECHQEIEINDVHSICGKKYVHFVETVKYEKKLKSVITWNKTKKIDENDLNKVLKIKNNDKNLNCNDIQLVNNKIIDFLALTNIKTENIKYLKIIPTKYNNIPLFQLFLKNENIAKKIKIKILDLIKNNNLYKNWSVGFWEIYNQRKNRYSYNHRNHHYNNNYHNRYYHHNNNNSQSGLVCGVFIEQRGVVNKAQNW